MHFIMISCFSIIIPIFFKKPSVIFGPWNMAISWIHINSGKKKNIFSESSLQMLFNFWYDPITQFIYANIWITICVKPVIKY